MVDLLFEEVESTLPCKPLSRHWDLGTDDPATMASPTT